MNKKGQFGGVTAIINFVRNNWPIILIVLLILYLIYMAKP